MLNRSSLDKLRGVHPDLVYVVSRAVDLGVAFQITCGLRTLEEQKKLLAAGKSKTLNSRHLTGHAVDFVAMVDGKWTYDHKAMAAVAAGFKKAAQELGVPIEWGGDWKGFVDTPHIQLPRHVYPASGPTIEAKAEPVEAQAAEPVTAEAAAAPPPPAETPGDRVKQALSGSKTIWGALVAGFGWLLQQLEAGVQLVLDGIAEISKFGPIKEMTTGVKSVGVGLTVFGLVVVVWRRLDAAAKGKIG